MEDKSQIRGSNQKLFHRIKWRSSISSKVIPLSAEGGSSDPFDVNLKKRRVIMHHINNIVKKTIVKERRCKIGPFVPTMSDPEDIVEFCRNCPSTAMSRFQEKDILKRVSARGLERQHCALVKDIMSEAKGEFLKITHQSGIEMKVKAIGKKFQIQPYKQLGRTENHPIFLERRRKLKTKFILYLPLIQRILVECVTNLPHELFDLTATLELHQDIKEFRNQIFGLAELGCQCLQDLYGNVVGLVECEKVNTRRDYLGACTGLLSVNISKTLAHTLLHVVNFTGCKEHVPYLKFSITFNDQLMLEPTVDEIIDIYEKFLQKIVNYARQFSVLEKYQIKGYENKTISLCLTEQFFQSVIHKIDINIRSKYEEILNYIKTVDVEFIEIYGELSRCDTILVDDLIFESGCEKILQYKSYIAKIAFIPDNVYFPIGQLVLTDFRQGLQESLLKVISIHFNNLRAQHEWENNDICEAFEMIRIRATRSPITTEEVIEIGKYMTWVKEEYLDTLKERVFNSFAYLIQLIQLGPLEEQHILTNSTTINWLDEIHPILEENASVYDQLKFEAEEKLQKVIEDINVHTKKIYPLLDILDSMDDITKVRSYLNNITLHLLKIKEIQSQIDWINSEEVALSFPKSTYSEFEEVKNYIYQFYHLLKLCLDVKRNLSVWLDGQFDQIRYEKTKTKVESFSKELKSTQKTYRNKLRQAQDENLQLRFKGTVDDPDILNWPAPLKLCSKAIELIKNFEPCLSVIKIMCNEALMDRHWIEMSKVASLDLTPNAGTTLSKIMKLDLRSDMDKYELISHAATKERELSCHLLEMKRQWADINFTIETPPKSESIVITQLNEIKIVAVDQTIQVIKMLSSIFIKPCREEVTQFHVYLTTVNELLKDITEIQFECSHLTSFLNNSNNDMQNEFKLFQEVTDTYKRYIDIIKEKPNVENIIKTTNITRDLQTCLKKFQLISNGIKDYLEKIRQYLPRFYLLTNDEILRVLSFNKNSIILDRSITKLFPSITKLQYNTTLDVVGLIGKNEILKLKENVPTEGSVEMWLKKLEKGIATSVNQMTQEGSLGFNTVHDMNWIKAWPIQILMTALRVNFTLRVHQAIENETLPTYLNQTKEDIEKMVDLIRKTETDDLLKKKIQALIVILINSETIIAKLILHQITNDQAFEWKAQLRFYHLDYITVKLFNIELEYGSEFLDNFDPIIITPQTEKCYHTLLMAYKNNYQICCQGETGSGKTETIRSLSNALALFCVFFSCKMVNFEIMVQFIKGTYNCGSWLCLEDFDNVDIRVISLLSQEILSKTFDLKILRNRVDLMDSTQPKPFLICFNMKQIDNNVREGFKGLFRPISLLKPNCRIIYEAILYSTGFKNYQKLARQINMVQKLSYSLMLSSGIEFNLRENKQIVKKCAESSKKLCDEEELICHSIYDLYQSKLTPEHLKLFQDTLSSIFPSVCVWEVKKHDIQNNLINTFQKYHLEPVHNLLEKMIDIVNILKNKTGVIIFGDSLTAKTTSIQILAETLNDINPKFINIQTTTEEQLFGFLDDKNHWHDGIISSCLRSTTDNETTWIVFDGNLSINCLEYILKGEQKVYLSSGEVLLVKNISVIYEMTNLENTTPGLISLCGLVYMDRNMLSWNSLLKTWLKKNTHWSDIEQSVLCLFDWIVPPCLAFLKNKSQVFELNPFSLFQTTLKIFEMLLTEAFDGKKEEDMRITMSWIQASVIQAVIWGLGSTLDWNSRLEFDDFFKQLWRGQDVNNPIPVSLEKTEVSVPQEGLIFHNYYHYKHKGNWKYWPDALKNEKIEESPYLNEFVVPTVDSLKYSWILNMHIRHKYPILIAGPTGTGKSLLIQDLLINKVNREDYEVSTISFSPKMSYQRAQTLILDKLFKTKFGTYGPSLNKGAILFIDDFNLPFDQACLELIRLLLNFGNLSYSEKGSAVVLENINIIASMTTFNRSFRQIPEKILRHFSVFYFNELTEDTVTRIFTNILLRIWKAIGFSSDITETISQIVSATYHFYKEAIEQLKPSLNWSFYRFNLRHFSKIIQVCSLVKKESADLNNKIFAKLWTHEICRVFGDRLNEKDKSWFSETVHLCVREYFNGDSEECEGISFNKLIFGSYFDKTRIDEIDFLKFQEAANNCLQEFNKSNGNKLDIVLFDDALTHLSKLCRILATNGSNLIQIGFSGCGRLSSTKLACFMYKQPLFLLEISNKYNFEKWRKNVKTVLKEAGGFGKHCTFLVREEEIIDESMLEDIHFLLKVGEIPDLYNLDEKLEILDVVRSTIQKEKLPIDRDPDLIFLYFRKKCLENVHFIFCFTPFSSRLQNYIKTYNSLIDYSEIDIFETWPEEALEQIGQAWIKELNISDDIKSEICFSKFHQIPINFSSGQPVTNGSFIEFIKLYVSLIIMKQTSIEKRKQTYLSALAKLSFASIQISDMQKSLANYEPQLEEMTKKATEMANQIEKETIEVEIVSDLVKKDEKIANEQALAAQILKLDCEADLAQAIPILEDAISALNTLKPTDITLVKSMKNPPDAIKLVMAAVCVIKEVKPDRIPDPASGRKTTDYWGPSKRILGDMNFLQTLKDFDKDHIKGEVMIKIRKDYLSHKDFKPHVVAKASSAAEGLCKWIIAMDMYDRVAKEVAPKKEKLEKSEKEYSATVIVLNEKKEQVVRIEKKLADLNVLLRDVTKKQQILERNVAICKRKLKRAQQLIGGLTEEKVRWGSEVEKLQKQYQSLPGDILITSAFIAYLGPFKKVRRQKIYNDWYIYLTSLKIPYSENFNFLQMFEKEIDFDNWHLCGLPQDQYFLQNGVICKYTKRWPLFIDPQNRAKDWIKNVEKYNGVKLTKFEYSKYMETIAECVTSGNPIILENISSTIPVDLNNLIKKVYVEQNNKQHLTLGEMKVLYNENFRLYLTTNLNQKSCASEVFDKLQIIEFSMTKESIFEHFSNCIVEIEKPKIKNLKKTFISETRLNKKTLYDVEEDILSALAESTIDILEDEKALKKLDDSKALSKDIRARPLLDIKKSINEFQKQYDSVARHSSILYLSLFEMTKVHKMYQFSLEWFTYFYTDCIQKAPKSKEIDKRLKILIESLTYELFIKLSRSIFEEHKLLFPFLISLNNLLEKKIINKNDIEFLIQPCKETYSLNKKPDWLSRTSWNKIQSNHDFSEFFIKNIDEFKEIQVSDSPETLQLPKIQSSFKKLMMINILRPEKFYVAVENFIVGELSLKFINPPMFDVSISYMDSYILSPLIFIEKPGFESIGSLKDFANIKHFQNRLKIISLQEEGKQNFDLIIDEAMKQGFWICLKNCHLIDWLSYVELKFECIDFSNTHENFRLWCTTAESGNFSKSFLENSVKITRDGPRGIRNKLLGLIADQSIKYPDSPDCCLEKQKIFRRLLYRLACFHCVVVERGNFDSYAWNTPYRFTEDDYKFSAKQLRSSINSNVNPIKELVYLVGSCYYGGQISDKIDNRLISTILMDYLNQQVETNASNIFHLGFPAKTNCPDYSHLILKLPRRDNPEIFGLHNNYELIKDVKDSRQILKTIQDIFKKPDPNHEFTALELLENTAKKLPANLDLQKTVSDNQIISSVIKYEMKYYNEILKTIRNDIQNAVDFFKGKTPLTENIEELSVSIKKNKVPTIWTNKLNNSFTNLTKFLLDFEEKFNFFETFSPKTSMPPTICLSTFSKPRAILTALKLSYSQKNKICFDNLFFKMNSFEPVSLFVKNLSLIGGYWDPDLGLLDELKGKTIYNTMNTVALSLVEVYPEVDFKCPIYKNLKKNCLEDFVFIKTKKCPEYWIKRGLALLCQIDYDV